MPTWCIPISLDAISFPTCYNLTWELGQTRCSCSNSTHRCSSSKPKHRHWSRCSHYQQQQGFQQYLFLYPPRSPKALQSHLGVGVAVLPTARFRFHAACGCSVSASRLNDHRTIGCRVGRIIGSEGRPVVRVRTRHIEVRVQSRNTDKGAEPRRLGGHPLLERPREGAFRRRGPHHQQQQG